MLEDSRPPPGWPSKGQISVERLSIRYRPELDLVLSDLSFSTRSCEKVGPQGKGEDRDLKKQRGGGKIPSLCVWWWGGGDITEQQEKWRLRDLEGFNGAARRGGHRMMGWKETSEQGKEECAGT